MAYYIRRRDRGDGTEGNPQCVHTRPHPSKPGKRLTTTKTFKTVREAKAWGVDQESKYNRDPSSRPDRAKTKFPALVEQWKLIKWATLEPRSRARYEQVVREHLMPEFKEAKVGDISREWVRDFLAGRSGQTKPDGTPKYAPGTIHKVRTTLSSLMSEAVERKMLPANPCHATRRHDFSDVVNSERRKMEFLTPAQVDALADAIDIDRKGNRREGRESNRYRVLVLTAAYTGLRASELHALRVRDVDLMRGRITVGRSLKTWHDGKPLFGTTKTEKVRTVELDEQLARDLAAYLSPSPGGPAPHPDSLVFVNAQGGPIHQVAWLRNHFKPAVRRALPELAERLRFHDLRHTYVSLLIHAGVHSKKIAAQAGHSSTAITDDRYGHLYSEASDEIKSALSQARRSATTPQVIPLRSDAA